MVLIFAPLLSPFHVPQSVRLCFLPHLLALVWRDVWVLWGLTLHNRDNKGSFLCYRTEAHLWSPTASPLPGLRAAPAVGPIGWKSPPGFFSLAHWVLCSRTHACNCCSPWLPLHFRSPGAAEKLQWLASRPAGRSYNRLVKWSAHPLPPKHWTKWVSQRSFEFLFTFCLWIPISCNSVGTCCLNSSP